MVSESKYETRANGQAPWDVEPVLAHKDGTSHRSFLNEVESLRLLSQGDCVPSKPDQRTC
jgi:hypothetical protein